MMARIRGMLLNAGHRNSVRARSARFSDRVQNLHTETYRCVTKYGTVTIVRVIASQKRCGSGLWNGSNLRIRCEFRETIASSRIPQSIVSSTLISKYSLFNRRNKQLGFTILLCLTAARHSLKHDPDLPQSTDRQTDRRTDRWTGRITPEIMITHSPHSTTSLDDGHWVRISYCTDSHLRGCQREYIRQHTRRLA